MHCGGCISWCILRGVREKDEERENWAVEGIEVPDNRSRYGGAFFKEKNNRGFGGGGAVPERAAGEKRVCIANNGTGVVQYR